jgi:sterol desaturase/sphingolipid hydroxylase (fatty acid hydroxylase superfamily)
MGGIRVRFDDFPSFTELFVQVMIVYFIEDFFFYWGHRFFHSYPVLYKMHKVHHEYDTLFTWITEYFHPLDFVVANLVQMALFSFHRQWDLLF